MSISAKSHPNGLVAGAALAAGLILASASAQPSRAEDAAASAPPQTQKHSPYRPRGVPADATTYYRAAWGVDHLQVRRTASGKLIRFTYRVTDVERARILGAKEVTANLVAPSRGVILQVPVMQNIGELRQTGTPVVGQEYWMVFSNKGDLVKAGDRVDVVIGTFHADGLLVE